MVASRCVVHAQLFTDAISENAVIALDEAIKQFGTPVTILSDDGSCFVGAKYGRNIKKWKSTAFEQALLDGGIELIHHIITRPTARLSAFLEALDMASQQALKIHLVLQ